MAEKRKGMIKELIDKMDTVFGISEDNILNKRNTKYVCSQYIKSFDTPSDAMRFLHMLSSKGIEKSEQDSSYTDRMVKTKMNAVAV